MCDQIGGTAPRTPRDDKLKLQTEKELAQLKITNRQRSANAAPPATSARQQWLDSGSPEQVRANMLTALGMHSSTVHTPVRNTKEVPSGALSGAAASRHVVVESPGAHQRHAPGLAVIVLCLQC